MQYDFNTIEKDWQKYWAENKTFAAKDHSIKPKFYALDMFPYPSGAGLHVGHPLGYIASDVYARYKRLCGFNVLHPMGYDSFGLPAEQYAIQTGQHPAITTKTNIEGGTDKIGTEIPGYRKQLDKIGFSFDWDREVRTSDPKYYRWTQWIFKQIFNSWYNNDSNKAEKIETLIEQFETEGNANVNAATDFEEQFTATQWKAWSETEQQKMLLNYRLAYLSETWVNWCPVLGTVLANDEIKNGVSERGGHPVEQKLMQQWSMRITAYAERLLQGLETVDWTDSIKDIQRNWIGKSQGAAVFFEIDCFEERIEVFTTRPDTIFGVSFMVLAPEHELVAKITTPEQKDNIEAYQKAAALKSERDRMSDVKTISGEFTGAYAIHPFSGEKIPVWIGDYVLASYGTGAVMSVPCGDQRDWDFANHFGIAIPNIFKDKDISEAAYAEKDAVITHSDFLNDLSVKKATKLAIYELEQKGIGKGKTQYKLRDAVFSRQRYWGEPFPVYFENDIPKTIEDEYLPIELPEVDNYLPTEDGKPPLGNAEKWFWDAEKKRINPTPSLPEGEGVDSREVDGESFVFNDFGYRTANPAKSKSLVQFAREMRKNPTPAEKIMWDKLRNRKLGDKFRRQHYFGDFIVDFVCISKRLVIEVDGEIHNYQKEYDAARTKILEKNGLKVIRFTNDEVLNDIDEVLGTIKKELNKIQSPPPLEGAGGRLEYNTMPGWAGSSWYFLRYMDPNNENEFVAKEKVDYWQNVDLYIGGAEHATGHLLYARFWTKFLYDLEYIPFEEPFKKMINQGMIQGNSALVYRVNYKVETSSKSNVETLKTKEELILRPIFVSKNLNTKLEFYFENDSLDDLIRKNIIEDNEDFINGNWDDYIDKILISILPRKGIHTDINFLDGDKLDLEKFKNWREEFNNAEFITEENGDFIVEREVEKMSKSKYNVQTPDELVKKYGADTLRCYEMFLGPLEQHKPWDVQGITGVHGFLKKLWRLFHHEDEVSLSDEAPSKEELKTLHKTIKKVKEDIERYSFNTPVSTFMICVNELTTLKCNKKSILADLCIILSPYAPHIAEELWCKLGNTESITYAVFPKHNEAYLTETNHKYPVSFNGKMRFMLELPKTMPKEEIEKTVMENAQTQKYLDGKSPKKVIVVPHKIVNVVV